VPGRARQSAPSSSAGRRAAPAAPATTYADRPWLASYPAGVPADFDFPKVPLTRLLDDAASSFPTGVAIAFLGTTLTYRELQEAVDRFATALRGLGVGKGDRVAIVLPNCPQNVIAFYATLRIGAVVVQHNPLYTDAELRHQLADCGATVVVCLDRVYAAVERVRPDTAVRSVVVTSIPDYLPAAAKLKLRLPLAKARKARAELTAAVPKDAPVLRFLSLLRTSDPARQEPVDPDEDLALLQYTGGTTGLSKGAMLTHGNLVSNAYMNRLWDTGAVAGKEVTLAVLPLFHAYGLTVAMNATVLLGGTLVLLPRFDLDLVFGAIDEWKPTMFPGVPPIYKALSDSHKVRSHDLRSIRVCVSGAMKLPQEIAEQFERRAAGRGLRDDRDLAVDALQPAGRPAQGRLDRRPAAGHVLQGRRAGRPDGGGPRRRAGGARHRGTAGLPRLLGAR
jgi:long-chain acyl-CoA synthetase